MPIAPDLQPLFDVEITICKQTSTHTSGYNKPGYVTTSNGKTYDAHIEEGEMFIRTETGREVVSGRKVFLYSTTAWSATTNIPRVTDKIILPAGFAPLEPQIISVAPVSDENNIHHILLVTAPR